MSARGISSSMCSKRMALPLSASASSTARANVRLDTNILRTPLLNKCLAASSPISPAPIRKASLPSRPPNIFFANSTAAYPTETALLPIAVSVRALLAILKARLKS